MSGACTDRGPHSVSSFPSTERRTEHKPFVQTRHVASLQDRPLLLTIDDEDQMNRTLALHLEREYRVHSATSGPQGLAAAERLKPDCVLLDLRLPGMDGMEVLKALQRLTPAPVVVIMTAYGEIHSAVQAIKLGAADYVTKPFNMEKLRRDLRELLRSKLRTEDPGLRTESHSSVLIAQSSTALEGRKIVGESPQMQEVWAAVERFAPTDIPILFQGESGTGKELFARAVHVLSKRAQGPFVPVDCAAVPDSLWESEFFGYEKGAFTGASQAKPGLFTLAHGGILFLDEVSNFPLPLQAKLLRALQEGEVRPLGARRPVHPDVSVVTASNVDLTQLVSQGSFRADLYYRLSAVTIPLPALREREGDIPLLVHHFMELYGKQYGEKVGIAPEAMDLLTRYSWPGNCRELENVIRSALLLAQDCILPHHLPAHLLQNTDDGRPPTADGEQEDGRRPTADGGPRSAVHGHLLAVSGQRSESGPFDQAQDRLIPPSESRNPQNGKMDFQIAFQVDLQNGTDLKQVGATVARKVEGEIVKRVRFLGLTQAEMAAFFKVDPKTLRAKLKAGDGRGE